jgi:hypothetical protein
MVPSRVFRALLFALSTLAPALASGHDELSHQAAGAREGAAVVWAEREVGGLRYRESMATGAGEELPLRPPYLAGFVSLEPSGPVGSVLSGAYLGGGEKREHPLFFPSTRVTYRLQAGEGARDLALAVAAPWPAFRDTDPESLVVTLSLSLDGGEPLALPVPIRRGRTFFGAGGTGATYSLPTVVVLDLAPGERRIEVGLRALPSTFGFVMAGVPAGGAAEVPAGGAPGGAPGMRAPAPTAAAGDSGTVPHP